MRIFISYSSKDRDTVTQLADDLDLIGHSVWYDTELNRRGGHQWWALILEEIRRCEVFLYALSPQVLRSEPCRREYGYARALGKPVLPVILTDLEIRYLPGELQKTQLVKFRQRSGEQRRALRDSLNNLPPAPPLPDPLPSEPEVPLDPVGVLHDRIANLTADPDQQRLLILDIDELRDEDDYAKHVPELLKRDDVLIARYVKRAQELLERVGPGTRIEVIAPPQPAEPAPGTRMTDDKGVVMVYVPAGKFLMGSTPEQVEEAFKIAKQTYKDADKEWFNGELPQHEAVISRGFWLDLTPVTNEAYARFVKEGGYKNSDFWTEAGWEWAQANKKTGPQDYDGFTSPKQPRVGVTWFEAYAYCRWRGGRLPTEAEWEYAARGPGNPVYPWGDDFDPNKVIYRLNSGGKTAPVGAGTRVAGASWVGALDMSGNVWEWVEDWYAADYYTNSPKEDPKGPSNGILRVLRGGSWFSINSAFLRAAFRYRKTPGFVDYSLGFRCARSFEW